MTRANHRGSQRGHYAKHHGKAEEPVKIEGCTIGRDSASGKAVLVEIDGTQHWLPYSQINKITRTTSKGCDSLEITAWIAREKGLAE